MERVNVTLDDEYAAKLKLLAEQMYLPPGTVARSLLSRAIDLEGLDGKQLTAILDAIPGAWDDVEAGVADAHAGRTITLDEFEKRGSWRGSR